MVAVNSNEGSAFNIWFGTENLIVDAIYLLHQIFTSLLQVFIYDDASRDTSIKTLQIEFVNSKKSVKVNQSEQLFIPRQKVATGFYSKKSPW